MIKVCTILVKVRFFGVNQKNVETFIFCYRFANMTSQLVAYFVFDRHRKRGRWSDNVVPDQGPERGIKLNVVNMNPNGSLGKIERFFHQKCLTVDQSAAKVITIGLFEKREVCKQTKFEHFTVMFWKQFAWY